MFSQPIISEPVNIELFDATTPADICLTESGSIDVEFPEHVEVNPGEEVEDFMGTEGMKTYDFEGTYDSNTSIEFRNVLIHPSMKLGSGKRFIKDIHPREIILDSSSGTTIVNEEVTVQIDMMCFLPSNPQSDYVEDEPLLEHDIWTIYGHSLEDREDRIDLIKKYKRHLRTATVEIQQQINGPPSRQVEKALDKLNPLRELISFIQGVEPTPIRAQITDVDGETYSEKYEHWFSYYSKSIGNAFLGANFIWGDLRDYLDESYEDYIDKRDPYHLNMVISWYLDSINTTRTLDTRMASICSGIELFAKRYSDHGPRYTKTRDRVGYLVNTLRIETKDLAKFSGTYDSSKRYNHEYFYSYSRQYVIHGDNLKITSDELYKDHEATLTLFQRLLRNQFLDSDNLDNHFRLNSLSAEDNRL